MTPLEKAARETWKLREQYMWPDRARRPVPDDIDYASGAFAKVETETRAIITAFLDAAAGDGSDTAEKVGEAAVSAYDHGLPDHFIGKAAILALRETL